MTVALRVITLNCWALPFPIVCKDRNTRISALCEYLAGENFDIVVLQEIWVKSDFRKLKEKVRQKLPYSHYFYSGIIGSGVCVLSKHSIVETNFHRFQLNGYPHKIFHGDWFGGKGVGLCKVCADGISVNLYCTHLHAQYDPVTDEYNGHRLTQAFELNHFVRSTCAGCDMVILAGDMNSVPDSLMQNLIRLNTQLKDVWMEKENVCDDEFQGTCDVPSNTYTGQEARARLPNGERIDYILYSVDPTFVAKVTDCQIGMGKIPGLNISYSDHEAVVADFIIRKIEGVSEDSYDSISRASVRAEDIREDLQEAVNILNEKITHCVQEEYLFLLLFFMFSLLMTAVDLIESALGIHSNPDRSPSLMTVLAFVVFRLLVALAMVFSYWMCQLDKKREKCVLIMCKEEIMKLC